MRRARACALAGSPPSSPRIRRTGWPDSPPRAVTSATHARAPKKNGAMVAPRTPLWTPNEPSRISAPEPAPDPGPGVGGGSPGPPAEPDPGPLPAAVPPPDPPEPAPGRVRSAFGATDPEAPSAGRPGFPGAGEPDP